MPRYKDEPPAVRVYTVCDESRCKPMDAEDCEPYTDVYWIMFRLVSNASFAKRKLDEFVFLGNQLQVSYAPQFENLEDMKEKLESRRKEVLGRLNQGTRRVTSAERSYSQLNYSTSQQVRGFNKQEILPPEESSQITRVSSEQDYFASNSMDQTVRLVRDKLDKIQSSAEPAPKKSTP